MTNRAGEDSKECSDIDIIRELTEKEEEHEEEEHEEVYEEKEKEK